MEWTNEAKEKLHSSVVRMLPLNETTNDTDGLDSSDPSDPRSDAYQDLYTDLKAHTEEALYEKGIHKIGAGDVEGVLQGMGSLEVATSGESLVSLGSDAAFLRQQAENPKRGKVKAVTGGVAFCLFGVLVPFVAIFGEFFNGWCSDALFNPMPTWVHVVLLILVPVTLILVRFWLRDTSQLAVSENDVTNDKQQKWARSPYLIAALLGFTLPTIIYYALLFIPVYFVAVIASIFLIGLLPLSPLFSLLFWLIYWSSFKRSLVGKSAVQAKVKKFGRYGLIAGFLTLLVVEVPGYLTQRAIPMLVSEDAAVQAEGARLLRNYGGEAQLLDHCYGGNARASLGNLGHNTSHWAYGFLLGNKSNRITAQQAREAYYRVTGVAFNSIEPTERIARSARGMDLWEEWDWDEDHGGDAVAGRVRGLSLHSSRIDTHLDGASKLGYTEWILEFKNDARTASEARMQIALPHGAVVSKLTLWVDGEERPAAFNTVSKVKNAYKQIAVVQRRDPVLVNVSGPDRVMLQCFPVPSGGGLMKTKVGITFPLHDHAESGGKEGNVYFPYIAERNFSIKKGFKHEVYAQSAMSIRSPNAQIQQSGKHSAIICSLANEKLKTERITWQDLTGSSNSTNKTVWTCDEFHQGEDKYLVRKTDVNAHESLKNIIVVIDGSECMAKWKPILEKMLENRSDRIQVLVASDEITSCDSAEDLRNVEFVGGIDNVAALRKGLAEARAEGSKKSAVVWLHGPQPVKFSSIAGLEQDMERSIVSVPIYNVALEDGENFVLKSFKSNPQFRGGCRVVNESDLTQMIDKISSGNEGFHYRWDRQAAPPTEGDEVWDHLARQWAHQQTVSQWIKHPEPGPASNENAKLAAHYQLVTPVSGAVVLESLSQYTETGLDPPTSVGGPHIPAVPEPSTIWLLFIGLLSCVFHRKRG